MLFTLFEKLWYSLLVIKYVLWDEGIALLWIKRVVIDPKKLSSNKHANMERSKEGCNNVI